MMVKPKKLRTSDLKVTLRRKYLIPLQSRCTLLSCFLGKKHAKSTVIDGGCYFCKEYVLMITFVV